jgi:hypothetical protein
MMLMLFASVNWEDDFRLVSRLAAEDLRKGMWRLSSLCLWPCNQWAPL